MAEPSKLEIMLVHLLNERGPHGRPWIAITVPGFGKFTRGDTARALRKIRRRWWQFWKPKDLYTK